MERFSEEVAILVAETGPLNGQRWALRTSLIIGRDANSDITIADRQVSRHHARFTVTKDGILLEDLKSKNGTHLNGSRLSGEALLQDGDIVQIALAQKFVYLSSDATVPLDAQDTSMAVSPIAQDLEEEPDLRRLHMERRSRRVWINLHDKQGSIEEKEILPPLSASQFRLLGILYEKREDVVPRSDLIAAVWGQEQAVDVSEQALDALVRRLRDRLAGIDPDHAYVITVRGHGLRLDNPSLEEN